MTNTDNLILGLGLWLIYLIFLLGWISQVRRGAERDRAMREGWRRLQRIDRRVELPEWPS